jgi:ABC-2 type transport system ATP-binding protein
MTPQLITARGLTKRYGKFTALDHVDLSIEQGRIVGLIGPNGAGKTTALRAILGLTTYQGELTVLDRNPFKERALLMRDTCFIADVAVLPPWLRVGQAIDFCAGIHPRFRPDRAASLLARTQIKQSHRVRELSKGMKTQVHLALAMAIDAKLLVLDEPTLGLDLLARRSFYDALVNDYMDETRTILVTTHQVEEIENLLTHVIFIDKGKIVLDASLEDIAARFIAVSVHPDRIESARAAHPFYVRPMLGKTTMFFEANGSADFGRFGEIRTPTVADLFVAKLSGEIST